MELRFSKFEELHWTEVERLKDQVERYGSSFDRLRFRKLSMEQPPEPEVDWQQEGF